MSNTINDSLHLKAQQSVDAKSYFFDGIRHKPWASSSTFLAAIPGSERHEGMIAYVQGATSIELWIFSGGIADVNFILFIANVTTDNRLQFIDREIDKPVTGEADILYIIKDSKSAKIWTGASYVLVGNPGPIGPQGVQGPPGTPGATGQQGDQGLSAYEIWLQQGNTGTELDFLQTLIGPEGPAGPSGAAGIPFGIARMPVINYYIVDATTPAVTGFEEGKPLLVKFPASNDGASYLSIGGGMSLPLKFPGGAFLEDRTIKADAIYWVIPVDANDTPYYELVAYIGGSTPPIPGGSTIGFVRFRVGDPGSPAEDDTSNTFLDLSGVADADIVIERNGQLLWPGDEYTRSGTTISWTERLFAGERIIITYAKNVQPESSPFVRLKVPAGLDGTNTLVVDEIENKASGDIAIERNGLLLWPPDDYTITGKNILLSDILNTDERFLILIK